MQHYRVIGSALRLGVGETLELTEAQYRARAHNLELIEEKRGRYLVKPIAPVEFKIGEQIGLALGPTKAAADSLELIEGRPRKSAGPTDESAAPAA